MYSSYSFGIDYMPLPFYNSMPAGFVEDYYTGKEFVHFKLHWSPDKALVLDSDTFYLARLWKRYIAVKNHNIT